MLRLKHGAILVAVGLVTAVPVTLVLFIVGMSINTRAQNDDTALLLGQLAAGSFGIGALVVLAGVAVMLLAALRAALKR